MTAVVSTALRYYREPESGPGRVKMGATGSLAGRARSNQRLVRVLDAAAVGRRRGGGDGLAGHGLVQARGHVVARLRDIIRIRRRLVVDCARVNQNAVRIDDEHVRRGLGAV